MWFHVYITFVQWTTLNTNNIEYIIQHVHEYKHINETLYMIMFYKFWFKNTVLIVNTGDLIANTSARSYPVADPGFGLRGGRGLNGGGGGRKSLKVLKVEG